MELDDKLDERLRGSHSKPMLSRKEAYGSLARLYATGSGTPVNQAKAVEFWLAVAEFDTEGFLCHSSDPEILLMTCGLHYPQGACVGAEEKVQLANLDVHCSCQAAGHVILCRCQHETRLCKQEAEATGWVRRRIRCAAPIKACPHKH